MNKQTLSNIIIALGIIIVVILGIWLFAYLPNVGSDISTRNADWGYFGEFFWDLGTMLLTGLNVFVLVLLNKQLHENNESQQDRQNLFMIKMEEERRSIVQDIIVTKRLEANLKIYYELIIRITRYELKYTEWIDALREITLLYKSMLNNKGLSQETIAEINSINEDIKKTVLLSYTLSKEQKKTAIIDPFLGMKIVDLFYKIEKNNNESISFSLDFLKKELANEEQDNSKNN